MRQYTGCQADAVNLFGFGAMVVLIGIVCIGSGPGVAICAPAAMTWLGLSTVAWGGVHASVCGWG
jgi:hypothetical protein